jgi:serine/threonine protein kinase
MDIKGANLLVDSSGVVKLADFGMAKHVSCKIPPLQYIFLVFFLINGENGLLIV